MKDDVLYGDAMINTVKTVDKDPCELLLSIKTSREQVLHSLLKLVHKLVEKLKEE